MRLIKYLIFVFLIIIPLQAQADDGYETWKKQALAEISTAPINGEIGGSSAFAYRDYSQPVRDLAAKRLNEIKTYMTDYEKDPQLWYLRGWITVQSIFFYMDDSRQQGVSDFSKDEQAQAMLKEFRSYYRKALDLDEDPDAPAHLDHSMLSSMGTDVLAASDIKIQAMKRKIKLIQQGDVLHPNQEWGSYEFLLGSYAEQKDYDNYLKTVNDMMARFPNSSRMGELVGYKRQVEVAIEKRDREAVMHDAYAQADTYSAPKAAPVQKPVKAVEPKQAEEPKATKETPASEDNPMLWWLLGGVGLLGVIVLLLRRKQS